MRPVPIRRRLVVGLVATAVFSCASAGFAPTAHAGLSFAGNYISVARALGGSHGSGTFIWEGKYSCSDKAGANLSITVAAEDGVTDTIAFGVPCPAVGEPFRGEMPPPLGQRWSDQVKITSTYTLKNAATKVQLAQQVIRGTIGLELGLASLHEIDQEGTGVAVGGWWKCDAARPINISLSQTINGETVSAASRNIYPCKDREKSLTWEALLIPAAGQFSLGPVTFLVEAAGSGEPDVGTATGTITITE